MIATVRSGDDVHGKNVWSCRAQFGERVRLFTPTRERAELRRLVADLLEAS
ncbi:MAG: hypothetical protein J0M13_10190 [Candidatus Accumulibacter sp.]|nr:hypothetical protein [Candidatus Accumulibacter necessarius]